MTSVDLWRQLGFGSSPPGEEDSQGPNWLAGFTLVASLCFFGRWIWLRRFASKFDSQPDITLQRKLFDDASGWKVGLWQTLRNALRWVAMAGLAGLACKYADTSYSLVGCFAAIALAYEKQQSHLQKEGEKKLGLDV